MAISKGISQGVSKGICFTNGNILTSWKVPFGMPYKTWATGSNTFSDGFVSSRLCETAFYNLSGMYHGMEVAMSDLMWKYQVSDGSCLNGTGRLYYKIKSPTGVEFWFVNGSSFNINIQAPPSGFVYQFYQTIGFAGINESNEFHTNGTLCYLGCATYTSGDDLSLSTSQCQVDITNTPSLTDLSCCGPIWVEGNDLHFAGARGWEHFLTGDCQGSGGTAGALFIDLNHCLNWVNSSGHIYRAKWGLCQFDSVFSPGVGSNPSPGASCKGAIWIDKENGGGWVNLAYIGCDGNKYIVGNACLPDVAP